MCINRGLHGMENHGLCITEREKDRVTESEVRI